MFEFWLEKNLADTAYSAMLLLVFIVVSIIVAIIKSIRK